MVFGMIGDMLTQGAERMYMQNAGLTPGQIDQIDYLKERYPAVQEMSLQQLLDNPALESAKREVFSLFNDKDLSEKFAKQMQEDPSLVDRVNYLILEEPDKISPMLAEIRENPDGIKDILNEKVTVQQAQQAQTLLQEQKSNPMGNMGQQFSQLLGNFNLDNFSMENIGEMLLAIVKGIYGIAEGLIGGISKFARSDEMVATGNGLGTDRSPLQKMGVISDNPDVKVHVETPEGVMTASLSDLNKPQTAPGPQEPGFDPNKNNPNMTPGGGMVV
ncbi:MAG: hypothetical protein H6867_01950 [Rhodospirillales bacterium]|nr:hypothetical protein [Rhodospirillales bacterium]MCB9997281.1 hypothetical protein [Rhodospirillales bacterium]